MTNIEKYTIFLIEQYRSKNDTFEAIHTLDSDFVVSEIDGLVRR